VIKQEATEKFLFLNKSRKSSSSRSVSYNHLILFNEHHQFNEHRSTFNESRENQSASFSFNEHSLSSHIVQSKKPSDQTIESNQSIRPDPIRSDSIKRESDFERELSTLAKLYTKEAKYSEKNDSFSYKLIIFHDMCDRVDISHSIKLKIFLTMLKKLALDYYYQNIITSITSLTFDEICFQMKSYFEDVEYKKSLLSK
jgi:hypothetical protein